MLGRYDAFREDPLSRKTKDGISVPFKIEAHEIPLEMDRLTRVLKESKRIWRLSQPPNGREKCKDCALFTRMFDLEASIRALGHDLARIDRRYLDVVRSQEYFRQLTRSYSEADLFAEDISQLDHDSILLNWDLEP